MIRSFLLATTVGALAFLAGAARGEDAAPSGADDLTLEAWLTSSSEILPGQPVRLGAKITNRSATHSVPVVLPGDGSESGWREPTVRFSAATTSARGVETPMEEQPVLRCGNFDSDWQKSVVVLKPGESVDLSMRLMPVHTFFDFQQEGNHVVRLHYAWTAGKATKAGPDAGDATDLGPMAGIAPYELVSNGVPLHVSRPLDVRLDVVGTLPVGMVLTLADLVAVHVENRTDEALEFRGGQLMFELRGIEPPDLLDLRETVTPTARVRAAPLAAHATRTFAGADDFRFLTHLRLRAGRPGQFQLSVVWAPDRPEGVRIRSPWVAVPAAPGK